MKSGTTSLYAYLREHPEIYMPANKEPNFFSDEKVWQKGICWYESLFDQATNTQLCGEASVNYTKYPYYKDVPARIKTVIPNAKFIYILRNPLDRIYSHYLHNVYAGIENDSFEKAIVDKPLYVQASLYYNQIEQYLKYFSPSQILVFLLEDLQAEPLATVQKVFKFLSVNSSFVPPNINEVKHQSASKRGKDNLLMKLFRKTPIYHKLSEITPRYLHTTSSYFLKKRIKIPDYKKKPIRKDIIELINCDIQKISSHINRDISGWKLSIKN